MKGRAGGAAAERRDFAAVLCCPFHKIEIEGRKQSEGFAEVSA